MKRSLAPIVLVLPLLLATVAIRTASEEAAPAGSVAPAAADTAAASVPAASAASDTEETTAVIYLHGDDTSQIGRRVAEGETLTVGEGAMLRLPDGSDVELDQHTTVEVRALSRPRTARVTHLHLRRGAVRVAVPSRPTRGPVILRVTSPVSTAGVRGTDFSVSYEPPTPGSRFSEQSDLDVFEGTVEVDNGGAPETVEAGGGATVFPRMVRRRQLARAVRERWELRRERIIDQVRSRLRLGENDDVAERLRQQFRALPQEKREQIQRRIRGFVEARRERARVQLETIRQRRIEEGRRPPGRPTNPPPRPSRR